MTTAPLPAWPRAQLVFVYGMACPLRCDFCCHPVETWGGRALGVDATVDVLRQAVALGGFQRVVFTGGEPLAYRQDLLQVFDVVAEAGLAARIVTAAHWATSDAEARAHLAPFVARGLTELSISTDEAHQVFVPREQAERAARIALELGLVCEIAGVFRDASQQVEDIIDVPLGALTTRSLVAPIGRARSDDLTLTSLGLAELEQGPCGYRAPDGGTVVDVTVYPDGRVYPCCAGGFQVEGELSFGNVREERFAPLVERLFADAFSRVMLTQGLGALYDIVGFRFPSLVSRLPARAGAVSQCEVCSVLHRDAALVRDLQPALDYALDVARALASARAARTAA